jgi:hypothetical protein
MVRILPAGTVSLGVLPPPLAHGHGTYAVLEIPSPPYSLPTRRKVL